MKFEEKKTIEVNPNLVYSSSFFYGETQLMITCVVLLFFQGYLFGPAQVYEKNEQNNNKINENKQMFLSYFLK